MPFSGRMTRKLSTCSLPAALLMEQTLTPSSSCDRFSPTGSTCSLDKYSHAALGGGERILTSAQAHSTQEVRTTIRHLSNSEPPPTLANVVVNGNLNSGSGGKIVDRTMPPTSIAKSRTSSASDPHRTSDSSTVPKGNSPANSLASGGTNSSSSQAGSSGSRHGGTDHRNQGSPSLQNSSWADTTEEEVSVSKPDWARLPNSNGDPHSSSVGNGNKAQSHTGAGPRPLLGGTPVYGTPNSMGVVHHHHHTSATRPSVSAPHTPIHGYHAHNPNSKRNPHEVGSCHGNATANSSDIIVPQPLHPATGHNQVGVANPGNWNKSVRPYLHPSNMTIVQAPTQQLQRAGHHHLIHHNQNNSSANGLMRGPPMLPQNRTHGILMFPPGSVMGPYSSSHPVGHAHPPTPVVACYNCGKRGHLGNTCPGVTMDATDTSCE